MAQYIFPIDTKSLYVNIENDNLVGHTATVATPIIQGHSKNLQLMKIFELKNTLDLSENQEEIIKILKKSKTRNKMLSMYHFEKISVNNIVVNDINHKSFCIYVKQEIDSSKKQFGRIKMHYPKSCHFETEDYSIDNKKIIQAISATLHNYAYIVRAFEYNTETGYLNFDVDIVGPNGIFYSKVFINNKGKGNKYSKVFEEITDSYEYEIADLKKIYGNDFGPKEYAEKMIENRQKAIGYCMNYLEKKGATEIIDMHKLFPFCPYDIRYKKDGLYKYVECFSTNSTIIYLDMTRNRHDFLNKFRNCVIVLLVTDISRKYKICSFNYDEIGNFKPIFCNYRLIL